MTAGPSADDAALLRLTALGDEVAFGHFVARHEDGVWRRAMTLTQSSADAEDVMQETFVAAWRSAGTFRGGSARGWLLTIAGHAWQRMGQKAARIEPTGDMEALEALALRAGWGEDGPTAEDPRIERVQAAFVRLSVEDQRVLTLRDVDEMSGDDVASLLGLTLPAMKSRLHRARLRLAAACQEARHVPT